MDTSQSSIEYRVFCFLSKIVGPLLALKIYLPAFRVSLASVFFSFAIGVALSQTIPEGFAQQTDERLKQLESKDNRHDQRLDKHMASIQEGQEARAEMRGVVKAITYLGSVLLLLGLVQSFFQALIFRRINGAGPPQSIGQQQVVNPTTLLSG